MQAWCGTCGKGCGRPACVEGVVKSLGARSVKMYRHVNEPSVRVQDVRHVLKDL